MEKNQGDLQFRTKISDLENIISQRRAKEVSVEEKCNLLVRNVILKSLANKWNFFCIQSSLEKQVSDTEKVLEERIKECSELRRIQQEKKAEEENARRQASLTNGRFMQNKITLESLFYGFFTSFIFF